MIFTNRHKLPPLVAAALSNDRYDAGDCDFSVTTLLKPPYQVQLQRQHHDEITEDVMDRAYSIRGQGVHSVLERIPSTLPVMREVRLYATIHGVTISGQLDVYDFERKEISDYKEISASGVIYGKPEHEQQLNMLAYLARQYGLEVRGLYNVLFVRDWMGSGDKRKGYPKTPIIVKARRVWGLDEINEFLAGRIAAHTTPAEQMSRCDETWGGRRCKNYCNVSQFCRWLKEG